MEGFKMFLLSAFMLSRLYHVAAEVDDVAEGMNDAAEGMNDAASENDKWAVHIIGGREFSETLTEDYGFIFIEEVLDDLYHIQHSPSSDADYYKAICDHPQVVWMERQVTKKRKRHIYETAQNMMAAFQLVPEEDSERKATTCPARKITIAEPISNLVKKVELIPSQAHDQKLNTLTQDEDEQNARPMSDQKLDVPEVEQLNLADYVHLDYIYSDYEQPDFPKDEKSDFPEQMKNTVDGEDSSSKTCV